MPIPIHVRERYDAQQEMMRRGWASGSRIRRVSDGTPAIIGEKQKSGLQHYDNIWVLLLETPARKELVRYVTLVKEFEAEVAAEPAAGRQR